MRATKPPPGLVLQGYFCETRRAHAAAAQPKRAGMAAHAVRPDRLPGMGSPGFGRTRDVAQAQTDHSISATPILPGQLRLHGRGRPLDPDTRQTMEAFFRSDFSRVQVYEGNVAPAMGALAVTVGDDIHFAPGRYNPASRAGIALLGHELAHVVQQRAGRVANPYGQGAAIVQDPALEAEADRMGQQVAEQRWSSARLTLQRMEAVRWTCSVCRQEALSGNRYEKPDKMGCSRKKGHDWKLGSSSERSQSLRDRVVTITEDEPATRVADARSWAEALELLAAWASVRALHGPAGNMDVFSNVGTLNGAVLLCQEMQTSGNWSRGRARALTSITDKRELLQHVGALHATITLSSGERTFFGVASNVYKVCDSPPGPWVFEKISQPGCSGGSCHTEQLCLYYLHDYLITLNPQPTAIHLQWYTEKEMCTLWCVPTLALFTIHWEKQGAKVNSVASDKLS